MNNAATEPFESVGSLAGVVGPDAQLSGTPNSGPNASSKPSASLAIRVVLSVQSSCRGTYYHLRRGRGEGDQRLSGDLVREGANF